MPKFHVGGKVVDRVDLLRKRHLIWRLDVWPFAILYAVWVAAVVPGLEFTDAAIVLGGLVAFHILVLLFTAWSVDFKCFVQYNKVNGIHQADWCKVTPAKFSGSKEIVPLHFRKALAGSSSTEDVEEIYFDFRKQKFVYSKEKDTFCKLPFPTKETLDSISKILGMALKLKLLLRLRSGEEIFEYPQPTFQKLMKEHCMEPFFVFQVFCVGLWCLDEYWYYSLFTLFMLFLFESTMAKSRLKTLTELRRVRVDNQTLTVHRGGKWVKLSGTDLLPGDVVSIGRSSGLNGEDKSVPADMLLVAGSAIVNEAILTGESTPQWKVSISGRGFEERLSVKRDKAHVLFGGTKILQHTPDKSFHPKTPDGGCLAVVLRTGFETSQGKLMRTILFSTERVTANSWESGFFILFLVIFAVIAAGYVLKKGLEDPTRSRYKLFLSCSLIITSVIPPELPMELSIAVNTSLIAPARRGIFCTEPFRIPFAGKCINVYHVGISTQVDICCFDKTGTLTSDDMEFCGVVGVAGSNELETDMKSVPARTLEILASCHALVFVDNKLLTTCFRVGGDPLEKAALKGIDWTYKSDEKAMPKKVSGQTVQIIQRHHFASHLKRMAVVVSVQEEFLAFVKGAPETIQGRLTNLPASYVETYKKHTRQGSRVLALAFKSLPDMTVSEARSLDRDVVESGLTFAGFAVFNCPIRPDSASILSELKGSSHDLVMIICSKEVEALSESHDLCIGGDSFEMLQQTSAVLLVIPYVKAHVGVALLNAVPPTTQSGALSCRVAEAKGKESSWTELNEDKRRRPCCSVVKLGDASMASPFTAKRASVAPTTDIITSGSQYTCYSPTDVQDTGVVYLDGVKLRDVQATISGVLRLPFSSLFPAAPTSEPFQSFLYGGLMLQVATFAVNYMGHPFNQSISENKPFRYALVAGVVFFSAITSDLFRDLNDWLKLVPLPSGLRDKLLIWAFLMFMGCYMWERLLRWAFPGRCRLGRNGNGWLQLTWRRERL
ncbi:Probable manganese-transporting ATPase pdr2 [Dionaea muscipula]